MLYTSEDTTGALLRDVAQGRLDLAVVFCAPATPPDGVALELLREEPAIVHGPATHPLADHASVKLEELANEPILVAASSDSSGFTDRVTTAFAQHGIRPRTQPDPYPDLGVQAVREGLGVVVYARSAFPPELPGSAFVPIEPPVLLPFHLAWRSRNPARSVAAIVEAGLHLARRQP